MMGTVLDAADDARIRQLEASAATHTERMANLGRDLGDVKRDVAPLGAALATVTEQVVALRREVSASRDEVGALIADAEDRDERSSLERRNGRTAAWASVTTLAGVALTAAGTVVVALLK